jgi:hypothetical protein
MGFKISRETLELAMAENVVKADALATAALATATLTAVVAHRLRLMKVDASYELSTQTGLLTVKSGTTTIFRKYIHGSGAFDFAELSGVPANAIGEAMSAELQAGAAGIDGTVSLTGFFHADSAS